MEIKAELNNLRIAPRKVRLVIDVIRGKSVQDAERQLTFMNKGASHPLLKLLRSAMANAKNNFDLKTDSLYIKSLVANEGRSLKRYMPRAYGRADVIRKRSSHILLVLDEKNSATKDATTSKDKGETAKKAVEEKPAKKDTKKLPKKETKAKEKKGKKAKKTAPKKPAKSSKK